MMTCHSLHAGDGYTYLTRSVASGDIQRERGQDLTDYYTAEGEEPGLWGGRGADILGVSGIVTEAQMKALYGEGLHPEADRIICEELADGASRKEALHAAKLGRAFANFTNDVPFLRRVREEFERDRADLGRTLTDDERTQTRYRIAADQFHLDVGRSPADESELVRFMVAQKRRERQAVAGYDCVFTPQKSVSVLWGLGSDDVRRAVESAHRDAVQDALDWIEDNASYTRAGKAGVAQIDANGLTYTKFNHRDNRDGDPNIHTHVAISTKVQGVDGKWRSLDGRVLHDLTVAASERYNTAIVAGLTNALGVEFANRPGTAVDKRPVLEIEGIPAELLEEFSRRGAIEARLRELVSEFRTTHGKDPSKAMQLKLADQATLDTRNAKPAPRSLEQMRTEWRQRAATLLSSSATVDDIIDKTLGRAADTASELDIEATAHAVVGRVMKDRAEWRRWHVEAETQRQLRNHRFDTDDARNETVRQIVEVALDKHSIRLGADPDIAPKQLRRTAGEAVLSVHGRRRYSAEAVFEMEHRLIDAARTPTTVIGSHASFRIALDAHAARTGFGLNDGQRALAEHFLSSGMLVSAGIGPAGTGKSTAMRVVADAWRLDGRAVLALGPSAVAATVLANELGLDEGGTTIDRVLTLHAHGQDTGIRPGTLVLVDEAGMASTSRLDTLTAIAADHGAVVRLIGDPQQLAAVESGGALRLIAAESNAPELTEIHRFHDAEEAGISLRLRDGDQSVASWYLAKDRVRPGMADDLEDQVFEAWRLDTAAGKHSLMLAGDNNSVHELNERARADAVALGIAHPDGVPLGDGLHAGVGDRVVTRRNDQSLRVTGSRNDRVRNGDLWTVTHTHADGAITVRHNEYGGTVSLPADYVRDAVQLGYASTVHRAQGMTVDTVHGLVAESMSRQMLYVMATRARENTTLYVPTDRIVDPDMHHAHPDPKIVDELLRSIIGRDGSDLSATQAARDAAIELLKLDYNVPGYEYGGDLVDAVRYELIVREHLGAGRAADMIGDEAWEAFVHQAQRAEAVGLDLGPLLVEVAGERELGTARSVSEVMHWRLAPHIERAEEELDHWADTLTPTIRAAFGHRADSILDDPTSLRTLAGRLRTLERAGHAPDDVIDLVANELGNRTADVGSVLATIDTHVADTRQERNPDAPDWVPAPYRPGPEIDPELREWTERRYHEIADRTRMLGLDAVTEQPAWLAHLGDMPESVTRRDDYARLAAHIAAYREQFGITSDRTLLGERPEHGTAAIAYAGLTHRINALHNPPHEIPDDLVGRTAVRQLTLRDGHLPDGYTTVPAPAEADLAAGPSAPLARSTDMLGAAIDAYHEAIEQTRRDDVAALAATAGLDEDTALRLSTGDDVDRLAALLRRADDAGMDTTNMLGWHTRRVAADDHDITAATVADDIEPALTGHLDRRADDWWNTHRTEVLEHLPTVGRIADPEHAHAIAEHLERLDRTDTRDLDTILTDLAGRTGRFATPNTVLDTLDRQRIGIGTGTPDVPDWLTPPTAPLSDNVDNTAARAYDELAAARAAARDELATDPPDWATHGLGPVPDDENSRRAWQDLAVEAATYRAEHHITDDTTLVGPQPTPGTTTARTWQNLNTRADAHRRLDRSATYPHPDEHQAQQHARPDRPDMNNPAPEQHPNNRPDRRL